MGDDGAAARPEAAGGVIHGAGRAVHWLIGLMEPVRHLVMNLSILAGVVLGGPAVYKQVTKSTFVIKDISVPPGVAGRGLSGDVIAQQIFDRIAEISKQSGSRKEKAELSGIDTTSQMPTINLPTGGLNLGAIIGELRGLFGIVDTKVTGEIFIAQPGDGSKSTPDLYGISLRVANQGPLYRSEQPSANVQALVDAAAEQILRRFDPINLGYYYYRKKQYQRASDVTDEVIASGRGDDVPWALVMRGQIARQQGHMGEAVAELREAITRAPSFMMAHVTLAAFLRQTGALDQAEAEARKAIELAPKQHDGYAALAFVLAERKQNDAALAEMRKAVEAEPQTFAAHFKMGRLQARLHMVQDAAASFKIAASLRPSAAPLIEEAKELGQLHDTADAIEALHEATHVEPKNPRAWLALGIAELDQQAPGRSYRSLQKAVALENDDPDVIVEAVAALDAHGRSAEADQLLAHSAAKLRGHPAYLLGLAAHLQATGHKAEAISKIHEALASEALRATEAKAAGTMLAADGDNRGAADAFRRAMLLDPSVGRELQPVIDKLALREAPVPAALPTPEPATPPVLRTAIPAPVPAPAPKPSAPHPAVNTEKKSDAKASPPPRPPVAVMTSKPAQP